VFHSLSFSYIFAIVDPMTTLPISHRHLTFFSLAACALLFAGCAQSAQAPMEDENSSSSDAMMEDQAKSTPSDAMMAECGEKNSECETSNDCCGAKGLECQDVRTSDGGFGKRCLPVEVMVCRSDCTDGTWGEKRNCKKMVASKDMIRCEEFIGDECKTSVNDQRNDRECQDT